MSTKSVEIPTHHIKGKICATRKRYREGRHAKAVKVYTVNNESQYLLIQGVPSVGATENLVALCSKFGEVVEHHALDEYPCEDKYTEVYLFKFKKITSARFAKKKLDDYSFYGGTLHVCYAPEYETVAETREKLQERRRIIASRIRRNEEALKTDTDVADYKETQAVVTVETPSSSNFTFTSCPNQNKPTPPPDFTVPPPDFTVPPPNISSLVHAQMSDGTHEPAFDNTFHNSPNNVSFLQTVQHPHSRNLHTLSSDPASKFPVMLPPPSSLFVPHSVRGRSKYEFPRVRSSHATFPEGYDGRVNPKVETTSLPTPHEDVQVSLTQSNPGVMSVKEKLDQSRVVIKDYKKSGSTPKFIPRQAAKHKLIDSHQPMGGKIDKLDQEIRQNAFHLGKIQGPENDEKADKGSVVPVAIDKSVRETIHAIRSQITKTIKDNVKKQI